MRTEPTTLTNEKFQEIYSNEKFRNEVAYSHACHSAHPNSEFKHWQTCSYPVAYLISPEQKITAQIELDRAKKETIKNINNDLVFVGMGMSYKSMCKDDVCNYRVRTEFKNSKGQRFFIEFGNGLRIDHAIDRDLEELHEANINEIHEKIKKAKSEQLFETVSSLYDEQKQWLSQPYNNYKNLERSAPKLAYTLANLMKVVNEYFDCNFKTVRIDEYNLSTEDFICISPIK